MKVESVEIVGIGLIENEKIEFNKPLIVVYGEVMQGKTTVLEAIKVGFGAKVPDNFVSDNANIGSIIIALENGSIERTLKKRFKDVEGGGKVFDGTYIDTMKIVIDGKILGKKELSKYVNPFQLNQNYFIDMSTDERAKFFIKMFGVDTAEIDEQIEKIEKFNSEQRSELKGIGDIVVTEIEKPNSDALLVKREEITVERNRLANDYNEALAVFQEETNKLLDFQSSLDSKEEDINLKIEEIERCKKELEILEGGKAEIIKIIEITPEPVKPIEPVLPSTYEIDLQIQNSQADQVRYEKYLEDKKRLDAKKAKEDILAKGVIALKKARLDKTKKLEDINLSEKIEGLTFDDDGKITFEGSSLSMISDSQEMRLSSMIASLYPDKFDIELIDRGESLGKSIFDLIEKSKAGNKTTLVTVVRDSPAQAPEEVGVYWMENGKLN